MRLGGGDKAKPPALPEAGILQQYIHSSERGKAFTRKTVVSPGCFY